VPAAAKRDKYLKKGSTEPNATDGQSALPGQHGGSFHHLFRCL